MDEMDRAAQATPIVEAIGVSKRYGPTIALQEARLRVVARQSHALVGRNGAGKSTLVALLTGLRAPDAGEIRFSGLPAPPIADRQAWRARVACVYQHSTIIPDLSVGENLFVNRHPSRRGFIRWAVLQRQARALLDQWNVDVSEHARAGDLKVEARQLVEIARALSYGARFIILDEPTAQLDARHIVTAPVAELPKHRLIEAMTGEQAGAGVADAASRAPLRDAPVALAVSDLAGDDFAGVSFAVRRGEVVGVAGATSSGRIGVAEAIAGLGGYRTGTIRVNDKPVPRGDVPAALALGVGCVPKSRHKQGLVLSLSVADNTTMTVARRLGPLGFLAPSRKRDVTDRSIRSLGVVTEGPEQLVSSLSGGNQQKIVMGRALATTPDVLVLMDPTAGVDVKSKEALLAIIERMRDDGKAILVVSGEIEDLKTCDRVLVMRHGAIVAEHAAGWTDNALVAAIEGI